MEDSIRVNGRRRAQTVDTLRELLVELGYDPEQQGIAVAVNDEVVTRARWGEWPVRAGDRIEIVGAAQGG